MNSSNCGMEDTKARWGDEDIESEEEKPNNENRNEEVISEENHLNQKDHDNILETSTTVPRQKTPIPDHPPFVAFVSNFPFKSNEEDIFEFFHSAENRDPGIKNIRIMRDRLTKKFKGTAFVEFHTKEGLILALSQNGKSLGNRLAYIDVAKSRTNEKTSNNDDIKKRNEFRNSNSSQSKNYRQNKTIRIDKRDENEKNALKPEKEAVGSTTPVIQERKKIVLLPRTKPKEDIDTDTTQTYTSIFGQAKPRDESILAVPELKKNKSITILKKSSSNDIQEENDTTKKTKFAPKITTENPIVKKDLKDVQENDIITKNDNDLESIPDQTKDQSKNGYNVQKFNNRKKSGNIAYRPKQPSDKKDDLNENMNGMDKKKKIFRKNSNKIKKIPNEMTSDKKSQENTNGSIHQHRNEKKKQFLDKRRSSRNEEKNDKTLEIFMKKSAVKLVSTETKVENKFDALNINETDSNSDD